MTVHAPLSDRTIESADARNAEFTGAAPFRHCVLDGFLDDAFARRLLGEFPDFERGNALNEDGAIGGKSTIERIATLGGAFGELDACVQSPGFLSLLSRITGVPDLLYDPYYFGGGTHENRHGQSLDSHVDFNYHPLTGWHRRLNLIVYLNPDWQADWGGALELHRDPRDPARDEVVRIAPAFNRCVVFETTEHSWHGFGRIALPEDRQGLGRKSVALYFYTRERPPAETAPAHSTVYVDRPLPAHLRPGHTLTEADHAELLELLARRDRHAQRLYQDVARLQAQLGEASVIRLYRTFRRLAAERGWWKH